jgi:transposase
LGSITIRVVNRVKESKELHQQIADNFGIGVATLRRWIQLYKETGSVEHKVPAVTRPRKVDYEKVQKFVEKNPDKTLKEIGERFKISAFASHKIIRKLNITYKKRFLYEERREDLREEYQIALNQIPKKNLIYLDESGFDLNMKKEYGWKTKGQRLYDNRSGNRKNKRITVISAYSNQTKQLIAPMYFEDNTDTEIFNQWIEEFLIPELKSGQTVILENAAFHKSSRTTELINSANCQLLYLPPYSPDFNPIEQKWGHVKNSVKKIRDKFQNFNECLEGVLCY